jgi:dihydroorotase
MLDLILRGGRVIDPLHGIDAVHDVGFANGQVAAIAPRLAETAAQEQDVSGLIVSPGLIDMHTHVYWGATSISVDATTVARRSGTTTMVDAGSAGAANFHGFRRFIIETAPLNIIAFLNISFPGIFAYSAPVMVGECCDMRLIHPRECVRIVEENRDLIAGIKVRVGRVASGSSGIMPVELALEVAEEVQLPLMAHIDDPPPPRREVLARLRPGDILTHCFKPFPNAPIRSDGEIWADVIQARERGVIFDLGHGGASFGFQVARAMLAKGFVPDVISSDVHVLNVNGPVFDLLTTLSKFYCLGLDLMSVLRAATSAPAAALRRPNLGHLGVGARGDATVFEIAEGAFAYLDCFGETLEGRHRLVSKGVVQSGAWRPAEA